MKSTANTIALNPADGKLRLPVRAAKVDDVRLTLVAPIERELFAHDFYRFGPTGLQIFGAKNRLPKFSHILARQCAGPRVVKIHEINHRKLLLIRSRISLYLGFSPNSFSASRNGVASATSLSWTGRVTFRAFFASSMTSRIPSSARFPSALKTCQVES